MGHEKKPLEGQEKNSGNTDEILEELEGEPANPNADDDKEIEEIEPVVRSDKTFHERILIIMEKFASYEMGQKVVQRTDRMLKILEETAKWSLPSTPEVKLERPLPWILFISLVILLRMVRFWCSWISFATRFQPVRPQEMVYFIQNRRRNLRIVRINGLRAIRKRQQLPPLSGRTETVRNVDEGFLRRLRNLLSGAFCKPGALQDVPRPVVLVTSSTKSNTRELPTTIDVDVEPRPASSTASAESSKKESRKTKEEDKERDLTTDEMLQKYGNKDSDDSDSDYVPPDEEEERGSITTTYSSGTEDADRENPQPLSALAAVAAVAAVATNQDEDTENKDNEEKEEIKENGNSMPGEDNEIKPESEDGNASQESVSSDSGEQNSESSVAHTVSPDVANSNHASTPIPQPRKHLAVALQEEGDRKKSTPGHESAASIKLPAVTSSSTAQTSTPQRTEDPEASHTEETSETSGSAGQKRKNNRKKRNTKNRRNKHFKKLEDEKLILKSMNRK